MSRMLGLGLVLVTTLSAGADLHYIILDPLDHRLTDAALALASPDAATSGDDYTAYTLPPFPDPKPYGFTAGDANCDGVVNTRDIDAVANVLACQAQGQTPWWSCWGLADVNQDGNITYSDLELLGVYLGAERR